MSDKTIIYQNIEKAAKQAKMTERNLLKLIADGRGPKQHNVAGHLLYVPEEVAEWRKSRKKFKTGPKPKRGRAKSRKSSPQKPERQSHEGQEPIRPD